MTQRKFLLVASTGGHLSQLVRLEPRLRAADDSLWITFQTAQSEALLSDKRTSFVPYVAPRHVWGVIRAFSHCFRILSKEHVDGVVSTGAGLALAAFVAARLRGVPCAYVESVSRVEGPSLTGRLVYRLRLAKTYTQHRHWAGGRWRPVNGVLDAFHASPERSSLARPRVFVTLGTIAPYRFDALVDALLATGMMGEDTVWQLGVTDRVDLPGKAYTQVDGHTFDRLIREADVVVTHAGVGTFLSLLEAGVYPVLVPRRASHGEHVDDHQAQIATYALKHGIARVVAASDLKAEDLMEASRYVVKAKAAGSSTDDAPLELFAG